MQIWSHWFRCKAKTDRSNTNTSYPLISKIEHQESHFITNPKLETQSKRMQNVNNESYDKQEIAPKSKIIMTPTAPSR